MIPKLLTELLAIYGALTATLGLIISLWVARRDRPHVRITGDLNHTEWTAALSKEAVVKGAIDKKPTKFVRIKVTNNGRRPLTITCIAIRDSSSGNSYRFTEISADRPHELKEGRTFSVKVRRDAIGLKRAEQIRVKDSRGRIWKKRLDWAD